MSDLFFVVRKYHDRDNYALEHWDMSDRYKKDERQSIVYRCRLKTVMTLEECIRLYKSGVRMKGQTT